MLPPEIAITWYVPASCSRCLGLLVQARPIAEQDRVDNGRGPGAVRAHRLDHAPPDPRPQLRRGLGVDPAHAHHLHEHRALHAAHQRRAAPGERDFLAAGAGIEVARRPAELRGQPDQPAPPPLLDAVGASVAGHREQHTAFGATGPALDDGVPHVEGEPHAGLDRRRIRGQAPDQDDGVARRVRDGARPGRLDKHGPQLRPDRAMRRRDAQGVPADGEGEEGRRDEGRRALLPPRQEAQAGAQRRGPRPPPRASALAPDAQRGSGDQSQGWGDGRVVHAAFMATPVPAAASRRAPLSHGADGGCRQRRMAGGRKCDVRRQEALQFLRGSPAATARSARGREARGSR